MSFCIEKGLPVPAKNYGFGEKSPARLTVEALEVGDSFGFPDAAQPSVRSASTLVTKKLGRKFAIRKQPDGTYRVWRTK